MPRIGVGLSQLSFPTTWDNSVPLGDEPAGAKPESPAIAASARSVAWDEFDSLANGPEAPDASAKRAHRRSGEPNCGEPASRWHEGLEFSGGVALRLGQFEPRLDVLLVEPRAMT